MVRGVLKPLDQIIAATKGVTAIVGTVRPAEQPTGRKLHNSAAIIRNQKLLGFADKTLLPEYDVFDDPRYFEPGRERHLFSLEDCKLGVTVCEDFWNDKTFWKERLYVNDPADELINLLRAAPASTHFSDLMDAINNRIEAIKAGLENVEATERDRRSHGAGSKPGAHHKPGAYGDPSDFGSWRRAGASARALCH